MHKEQLNQLKEWFAGYVRGFYVPGDDFLNNNLHLKECHTRRVCAEMRRLAAALSMTDGDAALAEAIGLLHDAGRFPQFAKYRTYKDGNSENHCLLSLKVIADNGLISSLAAEEQAIIVSTVEFHGAMTLPEMDVRTLHFARMIRDTDKLDIFNLCADNYRLFHENRKAFVLEVEFPDTPEVTPAILEAILNQHLIDYRLLRTLTDVKLLQLGWVYDTYFDWTLRQMLDNGYFDGIVRWLPDTEPVQAALRHLRAYIAERLGSGRNEHRHQ